MDKLLYPENRNNNTNAQGLSQYKEAVLLKQEFPLYKIVLFCNGNIQTWKYGLYIETWPRTWIVGSRHTPSPR